MTRIIFTIEIGIDGNDAAAMGDALRQRIADFRLDLPVLAVVRKEAAATASDQAGAGLNDWRVTGIGVLNVEVMP